MDQSSSPWHPDTVSAAANADTTTEEIERFSESENVWEDCVRFPFGFTNVKGEGASFEFQNLSLTLHEGRVHSNLIDSQKLYINWFFTVNTSCEYLFFTVN